MRIQFLVYLTLASLVGSAHADEPMPSTTFSGLAYLDATQTSSTQYDYSKQPVSSRVDPNGLGVDVTRFYLGVYHVFDDTWSAKLLPFYTTTAAPGSAPWFIKEAYLQGRFNDWAALRLGSAPEPWTAYVEPLYGYRFVEQTFTERVGIANTADVGAHLAGKNELFNYDVALVNGGGYKNPQRTKVADEEARLGFTPTAALTFALGFYRGKLGQDTQAAELAADNNPVAKGGPLAHNTAMRIDVLAAWKADGLTLGGEYVHARNFSNSLIFSNSPDTEAGYSLFGSYDFTPVYSVFARYDEYRPNDDTHSTVQEKYWNAGFAWKTGGNLSWALAYKSDETEDNLRRLRDDSRLSSGQFGLWAMLKF